MKKQEIKQFLIDNKEKLPISYCDIIFTDKELKQSDSKKIYTKDLDVSQFYKPLTRF